MSKPISIDIEPIDRANLKLNGLIGFNVKLQDNTEAIVLDKVLVPYNRDVNVHRYLVLLSDGQIIRIEPGFINQVYSVVK